MSRENKYSDFKPMPTIWIDELPPFEPGQWGYYRIECPKCESTLAFFGQTSRIENYAKDEFGYVAICDLCHNKYFLHIRPVLRNLNKTIKPDKEEPAELLDEVVLGCWQALTVVH